jgi:hypothetical protein
MISVTTQHFRKAFAKLPPSVKEYARKAYKLWQKNPNHPGLHFKKVHKTKPIFSVRISIAWRAIGVKQDNNIMIWFWIGSHSEYDKLIDKMK